jgi:hypothetical protein
MLLLYVLTAILFQRICTFMRYPLHIQYAHPSVFKPALGECILYNPLTSPLSWPRCSLLSELFNVGKIVVIELLLLHHTKYNFFPFSGIMTPPIFRAPRFKETFNWYCKFSVSVNRLHDYCGRICADFTTHWQLLTQTYLLNYVQNWEFISIDTIKCIP